MINETGVKSDYSGSVGSLYGGVHILLRLLITDCGLTVVAVDFSNFDLSLQSLPLSFLTGEPASVAETARLAGRIMIVYGKQIFCDDVGNLEAAVY